MNPVVEAIRARRSVRCYRDQRVPRDAVEAIIDAGNWAPTGHNLQRWRFVVVEDEEFRRRLADATRPTWRRVVGSWLDDADERDRAYLIALGSRCLGWADLSYEDTITRLVDMADGVYWSAPLVVFVIGRPAHWTECAMVCQNMMLAAQSLGLGSCIVGFGAAVKGAAEIVERLELKENERIFGPVVFGYPEIYPEPPIKKEPVVKWI
jgi:nitroreductase